MATNSESRKRREQALFGEPQWQAEPTCCEMHDRVLTALRKVYGTADLMEATALADALEDEGLLR